MSTPKRSRVSNRRGSLSKLGQLPKQFMAWLLRLIFVSARFSRANQAGFVLPTTVLLLLILTLTVSALSVRSFSRSAQVIAGREQQTIDNVAAPAVDRAKAKLEYLFLKDARFPGGVPSSDVLQSMMLNDGENGIPAVITETGSPYTFPDETRLDIDIDGVEDNAWIFEAEVEGVTQLIAYSILMDDENDGNLLTDELSRDKAQAKVTRNGPINTTESFAGCESARAPEGGWQVIDSSTVQKNFQITAFASNNSNVNRTTTALEFQQVRQADRGNKWGAWFKYDLELFPGAEDDFLWNGAMHTEGNFITRGDLLGRLISSPASCLYTEDASEITLARHDSNSTDEDETDDFEGQAIFGTTGNNRFGQGNGEEGEQPDFDLFNGPFEIEFNRAEDSVTADGNEANAEVIERITLDPVALFTRDSFFHRAIDDGWAPNNGVQSNLIRRIFNEGARTPFLDDTFRADNRYGPKPDYDPESDLDDFATPIGTPITGPNAAVLEDDEAGLDGFWERQAINEGLRLIVGQRLELGNAFGWLGADDPLSPVNDYGSSEQMQRRSLRDNLAAVQGMVVYHYESGDGGTFPLACMASTVHPGTQQTIINSRTFEYQALAAPTIEDIRVDFLEGNGTNGWEFGYNAAFDTSAEFAAQYNDANAPLKKALTNLAYFAGDPDGGAPSFEPVQDDFVHPFPWMAMWGDFSALRRIIDRGTPYGPSMSPADQSTLHSAACTLGLLAYNLESLQAEVDDIADWNALTDPLDPQTRAARQYFQALRDRTYGFRADTAGVCDDAVLGALGVSAPNLAVVGDAVCPTAGSEVKYPSLYYLFPRFAHNQFEEADTEADLGVELVVVQPPDEEYIDATATEPAIPIPITTYTRGGVEVNDESVLGLNPYQIVDDGADDPNNLADIANAIRLPGGAGALAWQLPFNSTVGGIFDDPDDIDQSMRIFYPDITDGDTVVDVSLLDKGMYDGRELLGSRLLDVDIDKLTANTNPDGADHWVADVDGIVYAFREDAVREDSVVRPKDAGTEWNNCDEWAESDADPNCRLSVIAPDPEQLPFLQDPPLPTGAGATLTNKISLKPVDFYADPQRRPYGFRLINGETLNRGAGVLSGMTFVSDNSIYIKGDFNLHTLDPDDPAACDNLVEEFTERLDDDCDGEEDIDFYADRNTLNTDQFAVPGVDEWRPTEIIGDAVGVLSANFRDGNVADGFILPRAGGVGGGTSSYQNQNRPEDPDDFDIDDWELEGGAGTDTPIVIDRNGSALLAGGLPLAENEYIAFDDGDFVDARRADQQTPIQTRANALFISGIIPSRAGQTYGGMHNFPRFLEFWDGVNLYISGGFFQLNFSTAAVGPFDQEAWEPGNTADIATATFVTPFYGAPNRVWGYDVGLQYAPAAPAARRFVTVGRTRSEFYRELPADDPYVENLRCAIVPDSGGEQVDPFADCA